MRIALTYDLREAYLALGLSEEQSAEFDRRDTIEAIVSGLTALGHEPEPIGGIRSLVPLLAEGRTWDLVFNIAEGLRGYGREAQIPALLEAYDIPYTFSDPLTLSLCLHKGMAKRIVRDLGLPTPWFTLVEAPSETAQIPGPFPLFAKPVAEGTGKGISEGSKILTREALRRVCSRLLEDFQQPVLVEGFLPGREFTVGILGTGREAHSIGVMEVLLREGAEAEVYSLVNKERCEDLVTYVPVKDREAQEAGSLAVRVWQGLGCRDAGRVDLRSDERGIPSFLEVNPLAGLHPEHSDLPILASLSGMSYLELLGGILEAACRRYPDRLPPPSP